MNATPPRQPDPRAAANASPARPASLRTGWTSTEIDQLLAAAQVSRGRSPVRAAWSRMWGQPSSRWAVRFLLVAALACALAPLWPLPSPSALELGSEPRAPVAPWSEFVNRNYRQEYWPLSAVDAALVHLRVALFGPWQTGPWLGTDNQGRDLLARLVFGGRTSLFVALAAAATSLAIGVAWGMIAAFVGGRTDRIMMRLVDALQSLPLVVMVIFVVSLLGRSGAAERERVFFLVVGAVWWLSMARVVRSRVLVLRGSEFIACARTLGASPLRLLLRHLLPNVLPLVIVYLTLTIPSVLLFESFLSFLGLGIAPPRVSWGRLALEGAEAINPLTIPWWLVTFPALAMGTTLLALNFLGDGLRDALDPRRAGRGSQ